MGEEKAGSREGKCNIMKEKRGKMRREKLPTYSPTTSISSHIPQSVFFFSKSLLCDVSCATAHIYCCYEQRAV